MHPKAEGRENTADPRARVQCCELTRALPSISSTHSVFAPDSRATLKCQNQHSMLCSVTRCVKLKTRAHTQEKTAYLTACTFPVCDAQISGVMPFLLRACMFAPAARRSRIRAAACSALSHIARISARIKCVRHSK